MSDDRPFSIRPGRIRSAKPKRAKTFLAVALKAAQRAGGIKAGRNAGNSRFGRGRRATLAASRALGHRARGAIVKARVVRRTRGIGALRAHIAYLQRDGVTRDGSPGQLFGPYEDAVDGRAFAERCASDRHHFRFIVSPDNAAELGDLHAFTRELMLQAEHDLGTRLDWAAIDHWNTEHPHVHILVRGRADDDRDLVISRDYISHGLRDRAGALVTQELGPRADHEIRNSLELETRAERWTKLDRVLAREAAPDKGLLDLRPRTTGADLFQRYRIGRVRTLERLGLATPAAPGRWLLADDLEAQLRSLGERGDIIKRLHRSLRTHGIDRGAHQWAFDASDDARPLVGRLIGHGLDDELVGTAFAIVDGVDGRVHHLKLTSLSSLGESADGAIVELRSFNNSLGQTRRALAVRSDWPLERQIAADGATWLDRQMLAREPLALADAGFGADVQDALERRVAHLAAQDLAGERGGRRWFTRDLLAVLQRRELAKAGARLAVETGLSFEPLSHGDTVSGVYQRRISLASGRFAMIDNGLGFQLVPWSPSLERLRGQQVDGLAGPGGIEWSRDRTRGLSI
jgi:type IV secretory pathway VirD2 relaxase